MKRKLTLNREALSELDNGQLQSIAAGEATNMSDCCSYQVLSRLLGTCGICSAFTDGC